MQKTIFFNANALILADDEKEFRKNATQYTDARLVTHPDEITLDQILDEMQKGSAHTIIIGKADALLSSIKTKFKVVLAAGGLVYNAQQEVLMIFRRGKWDLPKGKLDEGEDLEGCALREVAEETGVEALELEKPLLVTYHTYREKGEQILKESHWYLMHSSSNQQLVPQTDEDIEKCEWVSAKNLIPYLENTHPSIIEVLRIGLQDLQLAGS